MTSVTISTIRNSCIVNNANIAVQNVNITPLDAVNNWWGMPTGATHDNVPSGDAVGQTVLHAPHLPTMPFLCDLTNADWIPFSEQDLQHAINSHIPYLGGIVFALIDFEWGRGAKFDILTHPNYGSQQLEAKITIQPNPTGDLITIALDITTLPADENLQKIVTCELMPLFVNSLQQVQNRYVSPSQNIASMVVMERDLMMRFTPPTEITPEPTPEFVLNYDASCLPEPIILPTPMPSPTPPQNEDESGMLVSIPPLEGEFIELESLQQQAQPVFLIIDTNTDSGALSTCNPNMPSDCNLRGAIIRANADLSNHYVIQLPIDTYYLSTTLTLEGHITLIGDGFYTQPQSNQSILSPMSVATGPLIFIKNNATVAIYNLTFKDGVNGMLVTGSQVRIYHSHFEDNSASLNGGAISVIAPNTTSIHIIDTIFTQNTAPRGGAIAIDADAQTSDLSISCSTFDRNLAEYGGVIYTSSTAQVIGIISYSNFYNNTAIFSGGAIYSEVNSAVQIRWSYATSPTFSGFANYHAPNSIINAPMAIDSYNEPIVADCYVPPPHPPIFMGIPPQIAGCLDTNRDPIAEKDAIIADCIVALAWYGVTADASGLTSQWASQASFARAWTPEELREVLIGVEKVADAFHLLNHEINNSGQTYTYNKEQAKAVFRLIIGDFYVLRANNVLPNGPFFPVRDGDACNGTRLASCTSNIAKAITFYDAIALGVTQYTVVHEIGHRFNARSDGGSGRTSNSLYGRMQNATVCENIAMVGTEIDWCEPNTSPLVFGKSPVRLAIENFDIANENGWNPALFSDGNYYVTEWRRGDRGWGSGPGTPVNEEMALVISNYQQHSFHVDDWRTPFEPNPESLEELRLASLREREVDEATADMFLNWVYRKLNPTQGFQNLNWIEWQCAEIEEEIPCRINNEVPGDRRFEWMNVQMRIIFNQEGTNWR